MNGKMVLKYKELYLKLKHKGISLEAKEKFIFDSMTFVGEFIDP